MFWCVGGDFLGLGCVGVLAWVYWVCVYSGHDVGVCGVLVVFFLGLLCFPLF